MNERPIFRIRALPDSLDFHGRVRAGWLMDQIDMAGSAEAERITHGPVAVVAVNTFQFRVPVGFGDIVEIYAERLRIGQKSVTLKISVCALDKVGEASFVTEVIVTYVAIDGQGRSRML